MPKTYELSFTSRLDASAPRVWECVATISGVNRELAPWLAMTAPAEALATRIDDAPVGAPLFASWILLGGRLPIDRHFFELAHVERGRGFVEASSSWSQAAWEHRRYVDPCGEGACTLTDRLTFRPRVAASGPILRRVVRAVFRHRHRVLRRRFGGTPIDAAAPP
jgi:ligand-binding SRPBCC domain-containing protein